MSSRGAGAVTNRATFDSARLSYAAELRPAGAGNYTVTATAALHGRKLGEEQQLLVCEGADLEMLDVRAKPEVMAEIARVSGGKDLRMPEKRDATCSSHRTAAAQANKIGTGDRRYVFFRYSELYGRNSFDCFRGYYRTPRAPPSRAAVRVDPRPIRCSAAN